MRKDVIQVNQRVELKATVRGERKIYSSRIEAIEEKGIALAAPIRRGLPEPVHVGDLVEIIIFTDDNLYGFTSSIVELRNEKVPLIVVRPPEKLEKVNRRSYFRLDVLLNMNYAVLPPEEELNDSFSTLNKRGLVKNLSGNGLLAWVEDEPGLEEGSLLAIELFLPEGSEYLKARVVRKESLKDDPRERVAIGLQIESLRRGGRDRIIRYLFQQQRERRSKGLL